MSGNEHPLPQEARPAGEAAAPKAHPKSARRWSRELALQSLYQWRIGGMGLAAIEATLPEREGCRKADQAFCLQLIRGVYQNHEALAAELAEALDRPFEKVSPIEALLLLIATYEFAHCPETPAAAVMNEAIELAKAYGGTDGHRYVNGVLDKVAAKLRPHG
jgi:N utilization substance protein B